MKESTSLRDAAQAFYDALNANDPAGIEKHHSLHPSALAVGTADTEWYVGGEGIVQMFRDQFELAPELTFEPGQLTAFEEGDVGWFADRPTIRGLPDGPVTARVTAVAVRETGTWRIVQSHLSVGAGN